MHWYLVQDVKVPDRQAITKESIQAPAQKINVDFNNNVVNALNDYFSFLGAIITGGFIFPLILPILPFRSFALKGALLGLFYSVILAFFNKSSLGNILFGFCIYIPVISFMALNFTGATTFTSISGVKKEIKIATPLYLLSVITGIIIKIIILIRSAL